MNYIYILKCKDNSLYTGWTNNISNRLSTHRKGAGAKYTRSRLPLELVYLEEIYDKSAALKREAIIKKLSRQEKLYLISKFNENNCLLIK